MCVCVVICKGSLVETVEACDYLIKKFKLTESVHFYFLNYVLTCLFMYGPDSFLWAKHVKILLNIGWRGNEIESKSFACCGTMII